MSKHKPRELIVRAHYEGAIDDRRELRIHAAFTHCDVRVSMFDPEAPGEVDWTADEDGTDIEIYVPDRKDTPAAERAQRLADELRGCGLVVSIEPVSDAEFPTDKVAKG
jgi:hypothetical protein